MGRKIFIESCISPFHISARSNNKDWFSLPMNVVWEIMENQLYFMVNAFGVQIHSFVLMGNHFHLLASTPRANLSLAMQHFMRETSRHIGYRSGRINKIWGARFYRCELKTYHSYVNTYKYVYQNPLKAGLSKSVELYLSLIHI